MLFEIEHPTAGRIKQLGMPFKLSGQRTRPSSPPPLLGEHTKEILQGLGYDEGEIARLRAERVI